MSSNEKKINTKRNNYNKFTNWCFSKRILNITNRKLAFYLSPIRISGANIFGKQQRGVSRDKQVKNMLKQEDTL